MTEETTQAEPATIVSIVIDKKPLELDLGRVHPSWITRFIDYGARRHVNDANAGLKGGVKFDACAAMIKDIHKGEPYVVRQGARTDTNPAMTLAFKNAKADLLAMFKKLTAPLGIKFGDEFPDTHDCGPVHMAKASPGETVTAPIYFYRAVWDRRGGFQTSKSPEERASGDHQQKMNPSLWTMPAEKARLKRQ